ncbi:MAG: hypothetical protein ACYC27_17660 [Armatimonadota bacterium]
MNRNLSPGAIIIILTVFFIIISLIYWQGASPARKAEQFEKAIQATVAGGPMQMPGTPAGGKMPAPESKSNANPTK